MIKNKSFLLFVVITSIIIFTLIDIPHSVTIFSGSGISIAIFMFILFMYQFSSNTTIFDFYILFAILSPLLMYILMEFSYFTLFEVLLVLLKLVFITFIYYIVSNRLFFLKKAVYSLIFNGLFIFIFTAIASSIIQMFSVLIFGSLALLVFSIIITSRNGIKTLISVDEMQNKNGY